MTPELNGSGVEYPTIELGGKVYIVKFTRGGMLYRLNKSGVNISELGGPKSLSATIDVLHAALFGQFSGSPEDLAELVLAEEKMLAAAEAIGQALKKVFPSTQTPAAGAAAQPAANPQVQ